MPAPPKGEPDLRSKDGEGILPVKLPQSRIRSTDSPFCRCATSSPGAGEVVLWDGAFGMVAQFPAKVQSVRVRQRLPPRGSWQNRQVLTEGVRSQPLP